MNGKRDFVVSIAEGWPRGPDHRKHRLFTRHGRFHQILLAQDTAVAY